MSNPTELPDLLPCPFCGSTNLSIETNSVQPDDFHDAWVNCGECNADGRHAMTLEGWLPTKAEAKEDAVVAWNRRAQPEGEAPKPPFPISDDEMASLRRFWECATDGEGYDVEKPMMQRLAEIGLVQRKSGAYYMATEFGLYVLGEYTMERAAQLDGGQEGSESNG